ncbi:hypothetical protein SAMN05428970_1087 [Agromyces sp. CF514]|uniref:hypothetical protein n=1 Tax=Agromyces sp. CF514 TaxID=1881031 RepID=UPI0008EE4E53|nr:hypothetical protein [Agromyces sp. CF514]SFR70978.1 hypothetical protein SAMN05428970_1087 [Agromyces sp. CF514]
MNRQPTVLELRVHGIANAPPAAMLCVAEDEVVRVDGDEFGSFWMAADPPEDESDLRTEAYSWGNLARSGGSALAVISRALVHLGWLFVLPFGLCNLAYWARRQIPGEEASSRWWDGGPGAIAIRMFAVLQTLFYVVAFMSVSVDLIAVQCLRDHQPCAALPGWLDGIAALGPLQRSAVFGILPILVILVIYLIGLRARGQFDPNRDVSDTITRTEAAEDRKQRSNALRWMRGERPKPGEFPPLLESKGFWRRSKVAHTSERAHFAASIALVLFLLAWDAWIGAAGNGHEWDPASWLSLDPAGHLVPLIGVLAGAALLAGSLVMTAAAGLSNARWSTRSKRAWSSVLLVGSVCAYLAWLIWTFMPDSTDVPDDGKALGLAIAPGVISTICALIAVASLTWGYGWQRPIAWVLLTGAFVSVVVAEVWREQFGSAWQRWWSIAAIGLTLLAVIAGYTLHSRHEKTARRLLGWHGNAAAVALLVALFASLVITSLMVVGAYAWLAAPAGSPKISGFRRAILEPGEPPLDPPLFYQRFAASLVAILGILIVVVAIGASSALRRYARFTVPTLRPPAANAATSPDRNRAGTADPTADYPRGLKDHDEKDRKVVSARRVASLAHRGEPMLRLLAILTAVALVPLAVPYAAEYLAGQEFWQRLTDLSSWALGLLSLAAVAWVVTNAATSTERPLGLVWDIICFFPRAGHPFTPPCYAERTVPEMQERLGEWLHGEGSEGRRVIIAAHSMGATLAVAAIFAMHGAELEEAQRRREAGEPLGPPDTSRIALLTYGVQLRAYFSRFFPEVFGARVLGVHGTVGPKLFALDPWEEQVRREWIDRQQPIPAPEEPPSLVDLLGGDLQSRQAPRWRSLWRRTDYLGFPVSSYRSKGNLIDRGATERAPRTYLWTVARHNGYLDTQQYRLARAELLAMFTATRRRRGGSRTGRLLSRPDSSTPSPQHTSTV